MENTNRVILGFFIRLCVRIIRAILSIKELLQGSNVKLSRDSTLGKKRDRRGLWPCCDYRGTVDSTKQSLKCNFTVSWGWEKHLFFFFFTRGKDGVSQQSRCGERLEKLEKKKKKTRLSTHLVARLDGGE